MPENDDPVSIVVAIVPAAVPSAVMSIELGTRAAIVIAVIVPVPADADAEPLGARHGRRRNRDGRERSENARKLPHFASPIVVARGENVSRRATFPEQTRNFLEHLFSWDCAVVQAAGSA
jgi:hypothetical protein